MTSLTFNHDKQKAPLTYTNITQNQNVPLSYINNKQKRNAPFKSKNEMLPWPTYINKHQKQNAPLTYVTNTQTQYAPRLTLGDEHTLADGGLDGDPPMLRWICS